MSVDPYRNVLERFYGLVRFGEKLSLDGPRELESALGHPLAAYPSILVGGTNGKGSTCAFLEACLRSAGLRTGLFSSPHLVSFTERIRIDGEDITPEWVAQYAPSVLELAEPRGASFFEAAWGLAAVAFRGLPLMLQSGKSGSEAVSMRQMWQTRLSPRSPASVWTTRRFLDRRWMPLLERSLPSFAQARPL